jgi:phage terminase large subunit-like protein
MAGQLEIGNLYLIEGEWNEALIQEFCLFPKGRYADVVDAASGGFNKLALADIVSPEESETVIETVTQ